MPSTAAITVTSYTPGRSGTYVARRSDTASVSTSPATSPSAPTCCTRTSPRRASVVTVTGTPGLALPGRSPGSSPRRQSIRFHTITGHAADRSSVDRSGTRRHVTMCDPSARASSLTSTTSPAETMGRPAACASSAPPGTAHTSPASDRPSVSGWE